MVYTDLYVREMFRGSKSNDDEMLLCVGPGPRPLETVSMAQRVREFSYQASE